MIRWTIAFIVVAIVTAFLGFKELSGASAGMAQLTFFIFLLLVALSIIKGPIRK